MTIEIKFPSKSIFYERCSFTSIDSVVWLGRKFGNLNANIYDWIINRFRRQTKLITPSNWTNKKKNKCEAESISISHENFHVFCRHFPLTCPIYEYLKICCKLPHILSSANVISPCLFCVYADIIALQCDCSINIHFRLNGSVLNRHLLKCDDCRDTQTDFLIRTWMSRNTHLFVYRSLLAMCSVTYYGNIPVLV